MLRKQGGFWWRGSAWNSFWCLESWRKTDFSPVWSVWNNFKLSHLLASHKAKKAKKEKTPQVQQHGELLPTTLFEQHLTHEESGLWLWPANVPVNKYPSPQGPSIVLTEASAVFSSPPNDCSTTSSLENCPSAQPTSPSAWLSWCTLPGTISQNHRMFGVGRDLCGSPSPTPCPSRVTQSRGHSTVARQVWNISREGDSTTSLGNTTFVLSVDVNLSNSRSVSLWEAEQDGIRYPENFLWSIPKAHSKTGLPYKPTPASAGFIAQGKKWSSQLQFFGCFTFTLHCHTSSVQANTTLPPKYAHFL